MQFQIRTVCVVFVDYSDFLFFQDPQNDQKTHWLSICLFVTCSCHKHQHIIPRRIVIQQIDIPTRFIHVKNLRTALGSWFFVVHTSSSWIRRCMDQCLSLRILVLGRQWLESLVLICVVFWERVSNWNGKNESVRWWLLFPTRSQNKSRHSSSGWKFVSTPREVPMTFDNVHETCNYQGCVMYRVETVRHQCLHWIIRVSRYRFFATVRHQCLNWYVRNPRYRLRAYRTSRWSECEVCTPRVRLDSAQHSSRMQLDSAPTSRNITHIVAFQISSAAFSHRK